MRNSTARKIDLVWFRFYSSNAYTKNQKKMKYFQNLVQSRTIFPSSALADDKEKKSDFIPMLRFASLFCISLFAQIIFNCSKMEFIIAWSFC